MRYTSDEQRRYAFRDWLQAELRRLDFYQRRGDRYLVSEFARYAKQLGARVEEVSLGRYLRDKDPVLPTPESCRELARALGRHAAEVLLEAGYLTAEDFNYLPSGGISLDNLRHRAEEIEHYTMLPNAIRAQMKASLERQIQIQQKTGAMLTDPDAGQTIGSGPTSILEPRTGGTASANEAAGDDLADPHRANLPARQPGER